MRKHLLNGSKEEPINQSKGPHTPARYFYQGGFTKPIRMQSCDSKPGISKKSFLVYKSPGQLRARAQPSRLTELLRAQSRRPPFSAVMEQIAFCSLGCDLSPSRSLPWLSACSPAVLICRSCTAQQETALGVPITSLEEKEYGDTCLKNKRRPVAGSNSLF